MSAELNKLINNMMYVSGGTFIMGGDESSDQTPTHSVTLSSYYICKYEVTQALWRAVMGSNPSKFKGDNLPVEQVSWNDCQTFINRLNSYTGRNFRLPTEAEWEFAARGGNYSRHYKYSGSNYIGDVAWYTDNSGNRTHPVGTKQANELGLYDMSGNVWEWCSDWYGSYSSYSQSNPTGATSGFGRVERGGNWCGLARYCCSSHRSYYAPGNSFDDLGLRLVLSQL
ncbi:formylglycine-generating enzyme family protein [Prevotellamassilia timonensis]|uniref:formylglycine-generating enzyme family protein n=1 Tax=Prevotellamassilia timonensis TaxID=1852370 RepID=UPI00307A3729